MNSQIFLLFEFVATSPNKLVSIYNKWSATVKLLNLLILNLSINILPN